MSYVSTQRRLMANVSPAAMAVTAARPTRAQNLNGPNSGPSEKELAKKFAAWINLNPLFKKTLAAYGSIAGMLAHPSYVVQGETPKIIKLQREYANNIHSAVTNSFWDKRIKVEGDRVRMDMLMPGLTFYTSGLPQNPSETQAAAIAACYKLFHTLFPELNFENLAVNKTGTIFEAFDKLRELPIEAVGNIPSPNVGKLDMSEWNKDYRGSVKFQLKITDAFVTDGSYPTKVTPFNAVKMSIAVVAQISFPIDYAMFATSARSPSEFIPFVFYRLMKAKFSWFAEPNKEPPVRVAHPDDVARLRESVVARYGFKPRPRVNSEGLCVVPSGELLWVPEGTEAGYTQLLNSIINPETGEIGDAQFSKHFIGTDWLLNKLLMINEKGEEEVVDLTGARPLTSVVIGGLFEQLAFKMVTTMLQKLRDIGFEIDQLDIPSDIRWENLVDVPYDPKEKDSINAQLFTLGSQLGVAYTSKIASGDMNVYDQITMRPWFALLGLYAKERTKYAGDLYARTAHNRLKPVVDENNPVQLYNMPGVNGVMPHQARGVAEINTHPHHAILDVSAGGGKSFLSGQDVGSLVHDSMIRHPAAVMPRNLIPQFSQEIIKFSQGYLRPFPINRRVWRYLNLKLGSNPKELIKFFQAQGRNTIFIVDYDWLMRDARPVPFGNPDVKDYFFPHAQLLAEVGFDWVYCDESQRAKNLGASRTYATAALTSTAAVKDNGEEGYVRIGTGTLIHNTTKDLLGQIAQMEPTALGDFRESLESGSRFRATSATALHLQITKFVKRIHISRREWAHLLPPMVERVWPVQMTTNQQDFYNKFLDKVQAQVLNDPKIKALARKAEKGDEKAEKKIEALLKRYFVKLEVWLNAPDSTFTDTQLGAFFRDLSTTTEQDLLSPKINMVNQLVRDSFFGFRADVQDGKGERDFPASPNKILIIGYNKAVSEHIFRYLEHKDVAVHYTAGEDAKIDRAKTDDSVRIIVGDATTLSEGHNLQMFDRIILLQSFWTPGMYEQLISRVQRPDVPDKDGKMRFRRDRIFLDVIVCEPSIEVAKMSRLIAKRVEAGIVTEIDSNKKLEILVRENADLFNKTLMPKMILDVIRDRKLQTTDSLKVNFAAYALFKNWELGEFDEARKSLRAKIEARVGRKVKDSELASLSMIPVMSDQDTEIAPGDGFQGLGYTPWIDGYTGMHYGDLNLVPLSVPVDEEEDEDDDSDDDGVDIEDNITVVRGDPIVVDAGVAIVSRAIKGSKVVYVAVPGVGDSLMYFRTTVLAAGDERTREALMLMLKSGADRLATLKFDGKTGRIEAKRATVPRNTVESYLVAADKNIKQGKGTSKVPLPSKPAPVNRRTAGAPQAPAVRPTGGGLPTKKSGQRYSISEILHNKDIRDIFKAAFANSKNPRRQKLYTRILMQEALEKKGGGKAPRAPTTSVGISPKDKYAGRKPAAPAPINLGDKSRIKEGKQALRQEQEEMADHRELHAILLNGIVCVYTDEGEDDSVFFKSGFDRMGKSVRVRAKNPKGYRALLDLLAKKFVLPRPQKSALDNFADVYDAKRTNIAFAKARELPFHTMWVKDQKRKSSVKGEIRPWPVVEDGLVYVYINVENSPAASKLKSLTFPQGVARPQLVAPTLIAMVRSISEVKQIVASLSKAGVVVDNMDELKQELKHIRG